MQAILQETRDKLAKLEKLQDTIVKVTEEETRVWEELNRFTIEAEKEHGPLANNLVTLDKKYKFLADLELELMDIRIKGNIIAYERTGKTPNIEIILQGISESLRRDIERLKDDLSAVYMAAQPMRDDITHLHYKLNAAEKLTEVVHDKYTSCLGDRLIRREVQNLQYTIKLANSKAKKLEQAMLDKEKEIQIPRGRQWDSAERASSKLGRTIWDDVIGEDSLELPSTGFLKKIKQAVMKNVYQ